jgi:hypothetical protein
MPRFWTFRSRRRNRWFEEEFVALAEESLVCPICGRLAATMSDTEDSEVLEIDVRAHRRRIRRRRYRAACDCDPARCTFTAQPLPKLIPQGILGADSVVYLLDPSRGHEAPESHFGPEASGVLEVDRYSGYKAMAPVKTGLLLLAFCWAHVRRDFVGVGKSWTELAPWALERAGRGPAVARKNFYGSGSLWSGRLAAAMFSLLATRALWKINPRLWLTWYLENCAAAGGKAPEDIQRFLPWNLSPERRVALAEQATSPSTGDTS